ncbi:hypothetical protein SUGI_0521340 [Cryptomeria japonica]|uniref:SKP1-like protein 11 n=1 Tax=Cryptomeria japonica TaxID=3369 RepID=UPI002408D338|nr:SKP1-like protein 11 [Cryptomeria japonica]GLJ26751.1 hypothetical protein SUGI_0521340 [Cryptomeria japonica]
MAANTVTLRLFRDEDVYEDFEVENMVAMESVVLKNFIDTYTDTGMEPLRFPILYGNIKSRKVLEMVLDHCKFHAHAKSNTISEEDVKIWDTQFVERALSADKNQATFCHILLAANFLEIRDLFDLLCKASADFLEHKSVEEMRQMLKIENDFSEEEEEAIMRQTERAYA